MKSAASSPRSTTGRRVGLHLVLGGARSGKSAFAEAAAKAASLERAASSRAETEADDSGSIRPGQRLYLATSRIYDSAHEDRIAKHRAARDPDWQLHEEPIALAETLARLDDPGTVILVDCLTLWLTNLLLDKEDIGNHIERLERTLPTLSAHVILVANEVGLSVAPETALGNAFRDEAGLLNQRMAACADRVDFIAAGLPLRLKG